MPKNLFTSSCFQSQNDQISEMWATWKHTCVCVCLCTRVFLKVCVHMPWWVFVQIQQSQQRFYLVWLFLRQTHITLIKGTFKYRGNHLETIRLSYGKRFQGINILPLPHIPHGKRTDAAEASQAWLHKHSLQLKLCPALFSLFRPRHHPSFTLS